MGRYTDPMALYRAQKKKFDDLNVGARQMYRMMVAEGRQDAIELTSGTTSKKTLKALGHPFGRGVSGKVRGAHAFLPINVQSGKLRRSVSVKLLWRNIRGESNGLYFTVGYAKYILSKGGTKFMAARGFQSNMEKRWKARSKAFVEHMKTRTRQP